MTKPKRVIVDNICKITGMDPESDEAKDLQDRNNFAQLYAILKELRTPKEPVEEEDDPVSLLRHFSGFR